MVTFVGFLDLHICIVPMRSVSAYIQSTFLHMKSLPLKYDAGIYVSFYIKDIPAFKYILFVSGHPTGGPPGPLPGEPQ